LAGAARTADHGHVRVERQAVAGRREQPPQVGVVRVRVERDTEGPGDQGAVLVGGRGGGHEDSGAGCGFGSRRSTVVVNVRYAASTNGSSGQSRLRRGSSPTRSLPKRMGTGACGASSSSSGG